MARAATLLSSTVFRAVKSRSSEEKDRSPIKMMNFREGGQTVQQGGHCGNQGILPQIFEQLPDGEATVGAWNWP